MPNLSSPETQTDFVLQVKRTVGASIDNILISLSLAVDFAPLVSGKMLRTRLAARLMASECTKADALAVQKVCAATELAHTASLCHDDIIDEATTRRGSATLWRAAGTPAAVLIGDLLLCHAARLLLDTEGGRHLKAFLFKLSEVCAAEAEQELSMRECEFTSDDYLRIARGKTGSLFAFVAASCGGSDTELCSALEETGYRIGTAYQVADDLLDVIGEEKVAKKTLGTDLKRRKSTLAGGASQDSPLSVDHINRLCRSALDCLTGWPYARQAVQEYLLLDIRPVLDSYFSHHKVSWGFCA